MLTFYISKILLVNFCHCLKSWAGDVGDEVNMEKKYVSFKGFRAFHVDCIPCFMESKVSCMEYVQHRVQLPS